MGSWATFSPSYSFPFEKQGYGVHIPVHGGICSLVSLVLLYIDDLE